MQLSENESQQSIPQPSSSDPGYGREHSTLNVDHETPGRWAASMIQSEEVTDFEDHHEEEDPES